MARNNNFSASDGKSIHYFSWIPRSDTDAVVLIIHGMAEHAARYEHFAKFLNSRGYSVYAPNLRGHGKTIANESEKGFFAENNGWFRVIADIVELTDIIHENEPGKPIIVFGLSMGSLLTRTLLIEHPGLIHAAVLTGSAADPGIIGKIGKVIARYTLRKHGPRYRSKRLDSMTFGAYGKPFEPNRTKFDWLSRDPDQVDAYIEDPLCGFICTTEFFLDLIHGVEFVNNKKHIRKMKMDTPILMASGALDPVGDQGKGVRKIAKQFRQAGATRFTVELFEGAHHELLHETNRQEVMQNIEEWIRGTLVAE